MWSGILSHSAVWLVGIGTGLAGSGLANAGYFIAGGISVFLFAVVVASNELRKDRDLARQYMPSAQRHEINL